MKSLSDSRFLRELAWLARKARCSSGGLLEPGRTGAAWAGTEWAGSRDYSPGDDYRDVDWSVCARHDELVLRRPYAQADRRIYVLLDGSRSMSIGEPCKFDVARRIAAVLGAAALGRSDQLAVLTFADDLVCEMPPVRGESNVARLLRFLAGQVPDRAQSDFARAADAFVGRKPRPGPAVVLGDFLDPENYQRGLRTLRHRGYSPRMVHVCDRGEEEPDMLGDVELCDAESGDCWITTLCESDLARFRTVFAEFQRSARAFCTRGTIPYVRVRGDMPWRRIVFETTGLRIPG